MLQGLLKRVKQFLKPVDLSPLRNGTNGKFIFVHINKTAGTSLTKALNLPVKRHLTVKEIIDIVGEKEFYAAFKFTVVRNPWSKVVSHYKFRVKSNQTMMKDNPISFKNWVSLTYGQNKDSYYYDKPKMFQPQLEWLKDYNGKIAVDKIIKFENLSSEFAEIALILGTEHSLPHLNKTDQDSYINYYDEESKNIISEWFREDIEYFNYKFGE